MTTLTIPEAEALMDRLRKLRERKDRFVDMMFSRKRALLNDENFKDWMGLSVAVDKSYSEKMNRIYSRTEETPYYWRKIADLPDL